MKFDLKYNRLTISYSGPNKVILKIGDLNSRPHALVDATAIGADEKMLEDFINLFSSEEKIAFRSFSSVLSAAEGDTQDLEVWVYGNSEKTDLRTWNYLKGMQTFFEAIDCSIVIYDDEAQAFFHKLDYSATVCHGVVRGCGCDGTGPCPENWKISHA